MTTDCISAFTIVQPQQFPAFISINADTETGNVAVTVRGPSKQMDHPPYYQVAGDTASITLTPVQLLMLCRDVFERYGRTSAQPKSTLREDMRAFLDKVERGDVPTTTFTREVVEQIGDLAYTERETVSYSGHSSDVVDSGHLGLSANGDKPEYPNDHLDPAD